MAKEKNGKKKNGKRQKERRDFLKGIGAIGASATIGASVGSKATLAQETQEEKRMQGKGQPVVKIDPKVGAVALNHEAVRLIAYRLRDDMKEDRCLKARFLRNPREVLGSVGLNEELQSEILRVDTDFAGKDSPFFSEAVARWCICTRCCCTNCCITCWFTRLFSTT